MPAEPRWKFKTNLCSFLSEFTVTEGTETISVEDIGDWSILPGSLKRFSGGFEHDLLYCPSALTFEAVVAYPAGPIRLEVDSIQTQVWCGQILWRNIRFIVSKKIRRWCRLVAT